MPITAVEWYDHDPDIKNLDQGDVMDGVPLLFAPPPHVRWVLLRPLPQGPLEGARGGLPRKFVANVDGALPTAWNREDGELVMASAAAYRIIILSRGCNLDWKKQIQVAPVYRVEAGMKEQDLACLRANQNAFSFYLPPDGEGLNESYADLSLKTTVHISYLRRTDALVRRLTCLARTALQEVLSEYYAKPFGFNTNDPVPQNALYRCGSCFFSGAIDVPICDIYTGGNFPPCRICGDKALWLKVPRA